MAEVIYPIAPGSVSTPSEQETPGFSPARFSSFIGFGIITPFRRGPNDFVSAGGQAFLQSLVAQTLGTICDSETTQGEIPWRTEFGSLVNNVRHMNNNTVAAELARLYIADALSQWVPQIQIKNVAIEKKEGPTGEKNILLIALHYDIISVNQPGNNVLIPDVSQNVEVPING